MISSFSLRLGAVACTAAALWSTSTFALPVRTSGDVSTLHAQLRAGATGEFVDSRSPVTERWQMIRATGVLVPDDTSDTPENRARFFLSVYGALVGIDDASQLVLQRISKDAAGNTHVHFDQAYNGLSVYGARVVVHLGDTGVTGVNGLGIPGLDAVDTSTRLPFATLRARVLSVANRLHPGSAVAIDSRKLLYYRDGMLKGEAGQTRLAYSVRMLGQGINEQVFVDARSGNVLEQVPLAGHALYRKIYSPSYDPTRENLFLLRQEGDAPLVPVPIPIVGDPVDNLYDFAGGVYTFYKNLFGRDSYDDHGAAMHSVYLVNDQCPNAYWDGTATNYCPDFDFDDVVSHEWTHAVSQYTHGLIYAYQSGALNESYSDIFGESIDLTNGRDALGGTKNDQPYPDGVRWMIGEDFSLGLIDTVDSHTGYLITSILNRDMWDPDRLLSPGKVSSANYACSSSDEGGVHTNSGVPNHGYALLVDGGTYNDKTVAGIGMVKALNIYYGAMTSYQTPTTNFHQHELALEAACSSLVGVALNGFDGNPSGQKITRRDCRQVKLAMAAVEMSKAPTQCNFRPILLPGRPPQDCPDGTTMKRGFAKAFTNDTAVPAAYTLASTGSTADWPGTNWVVATTLPGNHAGHALYAKNDRGGTCAAGGDISGKFSVDTPVITVGAGIGRFGFSHYVATEVGFDGGNVAVSVNDGAFALIPAANYLFNGPNATLNAAAPPIAIPDPTGLIGNNSDPKAGEEAWTGTDPGKQTGSWGQTLVDLTGIAAAGDQVKFRFEFGQDCGNGVDGWYVDHIRTYGCVTP